ncbi:GNAT family N-acetyltransferase [Micromonospora sp. NPDC049903]|uniref:GNAT family N-acetyltransferase n=1 Tax=Micromonospora sp. NPDC049903 TaxID=3364276 RepID=UPI00378C6E94
MSNELGLRHHNAAEAQALTDELVEVYLDAHADDGAFYNEERYRQQLAGHIKVSGWTVVTAQVGGSLVGYIYGFPLSPRTRWWEGIRGDVPPGFTEEDGRRTFAISELLVRADSRRQGVARTLHDRLLSGRTEKRATLLVRPDNAIALRAYDSWGWTQQARLRPGWENAPEFIVLTKALPSANTHGQR